MRVWAWFGGWHNGGRVQNASGTAAGRSALLIVPLGECWRHPGRSEPRHSATVPSRKVWRVQVGYQDTWAMTGRLGKVMVRSATATA